MSSPHPEASSPPPGAERAFGLWTLLGIALLARLPAVIWSRGYEFLDEQFQYVDPAFHLATGMPFVETHEWVSGLRSWLYPGLLAGVFRAADAVGITTAEGQMLFTRATFALVSLLAVYGLHRALGTGARPLPRLAMLLATCNGILVYQSVHTNGPALSCVLVVFAVGVFTRPGRIHALAAGAAIGLAFGCRPQDGLFGVALGAAGLWQRRWIDTALMTAGALTLLVVQGFVDRETWGTFLASPIEYVRYNLEHSAGWGSQPWWFYPLVASALAPLLHTGWQAVVRGARHAPWITFAVLLTLGAHQILERKAVRFVTPGLALFVVLWALGMARGAGSGRWRTWSIHVAILGHIIGWGFASFSYPNRNRIETAKFLAAQDDLTAVVYADLNATDIGGYFYYRRTEPIYAIPATGLLAQLRNPNHPTPSHLVARGDHDVVAPDGWTLRHLTTSHCIFGLRKKASYHVYRIVRNE